MRTHEFIYNNKKTLFMVDQNRDFSNSEGMVYNYDYIYRVVDISGDLISKVDEFDGNGYGFGTVVKMSIDHLEQLDKNIKKMITNAINGEGLSKDLAVNKNDKVNKIKVKFEEDGADMVVLIKIVNKDAYVMIFDSMPIYINYHFLFSGIHNFNNKNMSIGLDQEPIEDKKNNFYFYCGDENTDSEFDNWLEEEAPKIHKVFRELKIIQE